MRNPLIALIPAVLMAGAAYAQSETDIDAPPPAEQEQIAEPEAAAEEQDAEEQQTVQAEEVQADKVQGSWNRISQGSQQTAEFLSANGDVLFSVTCKPLEDGAGDKVVEIRSVAGEEGVQAIDIFTTAGNVRLDAAPGVTPGTATGLTQPISRPTYVLASGAGEIEVVAGASGIIFETDAMLKEVIRDCHPEPTGIRATDKEDEEASEEASGETDATGADAANETDPEN